ncbi:MAG: class I mannose-6-phosphate isomerase [bacterium]|nr:class I mannose-6-phosphate isomerase [bacterium]
MKREIIFLEPAFKQVIWGGNKLGADFGYDIPGDNTGECWAISAHPKGDCKVISGQYAGMNLSRLWDKHRELFGNAKGDRYPLLIKIIDAKQDLSIQVHPDDKYAAEHENGSLGKTECWYVLDCDENAAVVIGHNARDKAELEKMIRGKHWGEFIREIPVHKGDFFQIEPGCLHAIKGGTLILETQQNSDITYRVYDYDRLQNGKPRELHIEQSIEVIKAPFEAAQCSRSVLRQDNMMIEKLVDCEYYSVEKIDVTGKALAEQKHSFLNVSMIGGAGRINGMEICKGKNFIIPARYGTMELDGDMSMIVSYTEEMEEKYDKTDNKNDAGKERKALSGRYMSSHGYCR